MGNGFWKEYKRVIRMKELSYISRLLFSLLFTYRNNETGECFPRTKTLREDLGAGRRQIYNGLKELEDHGIIKINRKPGRRNSYEFLGELNQCPQRAPVSPEGTTLEGKPVSPEGTTVVSPEGTTNITKYLTIKKEFYKKEIELSDNDPEYISFIKSLFGDNELSKPIEKVLKMNDQIHYKTFRKMQAMILILQRGGVKKSLFDIVLDYYNKDTKDKSFTLTMYKWIKNVAKWNNVEMKSMEEIEAYLKKEDEKEATEHDKKPEGATVQG